MVILLDTNIIIDHLRQKAVRPTLHKQLVSQYRYPLLAVSTITIQELYIGQSTKNSQDHKKLAQTIEPLKAYSLTSTIAHLAGELMRDSKTNLQFADAAIAATALHYHANLATLNTKDFAGIPNLKLLKLLKL